MEICGVEIDFNKQNGYFINADCMEGMKQFPDKYFDLAVVDPPYGINVGQSSMGAGGGTAKSAERSPSGSQVRVGGVSLSYPKFTRRSTTATSRAPHISKN